MQMFWCSQALKNAVYEEDHLELFLEFETPNGYRDIKQKLFEHIFLNEKTKMAFASLQRNASFDQDFCPINSNETCKLTQVCCPNKTACCPDELL